MNKKIIPITKGLLLTITEANKFSSARCKHKKISVDEELQEVMCKICGAKLNPIAILLKVAYEETNWSYRFQALKEIEEKLDKKIRTKCRHCGKMTDVNI
jgi:transcription elongation factor Elf1